MSEEISPRWLEFIDEYLKTGNARQSALKVGFTEAYANIITQRIPVKVRKSMQEALEAKGITPERIAESIDFLLEHDNFQAVDKGITHAAKMGVGGGYVPEKHVNLNYDVELTDEERKLAAELLARQKA